MKLQTPVTFSPSRIPVSPAYKTLVAGICFADHVG